MSETNQMLQAQTHAIVESVQHQDTTISKDENGVNRYEALRMFGLNPDNRHQSVRKSEDIKVYLEMHIEQGPQLDSLGKPIGIVTGIAGPAWLTIILTGEAGHAGTVPMNLRRDPLVGAAEVIQSIEKICGSDPSVPTVGTVGKITAKPGGANVIPQSVEFSLDVRDVDLTRRDKAISLIESVIEKVCKGRGLKYKIEENLSIRPTPCSALVIETMEDICRNVGFEVPKMVSGAGHDAMFMAEITDIGMIFVRCRDGISHSPKEWADTEDIVKGTELLLATVLRYSLLK